MRGERAWLSAPAMRFDFALLSPADGYLAIFARLANLPPATATKPCRQ